MRQSKGTDLKSAFNWTKIWLSVDTNMATEVICGDARCQGLSKLQRADALREEQDRLMVEQGTSLID